MADLKGKKLSDLSWKPMDGLFVSPAIHAEDVITPITIPIDRPESHKIPTAWIHSGDKETQRNRVQQLLNWGIGRIIFYPKSTEEKDRSTLLDGVDLNMVDVQFPHRLHQIHFTDATTWLTSAQEAIRGSMDDEDVIALHLGPDFYLNVCATRALLLTLSDRTGDKSPALIANYKGQKDLDLATQLMQSMPIMLAGLLAGADGIATDHIHRPEDERLLLNNCHLLLLESGIPIDIDTVAGSYYLDLATGLFADKLKDALQSQTDKK